MNQWMRSPKWATVPVLRCQLNDWGSETKLIYQGHGYAIRWFFIWLHASTGALMHEVYRNQTFPLIDIFCMRGDNCFILP